MFEPQLYRLPSALRAMVWKPPADTRFHGEVTAMVMVPTTPSWVALTDSLPTPLPVTMPVVKICSTVLAPLLTSHFTPLAALSALVVPSEKVPVATSVWLAPMGMVAFGAVTAMLFSVATAGVDGVLLPPPPPP